MATNIITCSIPVELAKFLDENPEISPSKVLQQKLFAMREDEARLFERVKALEIRNERVVARWNKLLDWAKELDVGIPAYVLD